MALGEMLVWPKIQRLGNEQMVVTEKLDGTSGCLFFSEEGEMHVQSRNRILSPEKDNAGFCAWAVENHESLFADLGPGYAFGEWWGAGIQRRYGMDRKVFSLFNTHRWGARNNAAMAGHEEAKWATPNLSVVPLLWTGPVDTEVLRVVAAELYLHGSVAVPGWDAPEGVVAYLAASRVSWKITDAVAGPGKHA